MFSCFSASTNASQRTHCSSYKKCTPWNTMANVNVTTRVWFTRSFSLTQTGYLYCYYYSVVCLTTGPKPPPKRFLHIVRSKASSFKWEYPLLSLRSSSSFLRLLPRRLVTSISPFIFPSITCFRRQFVRKMWPICNSSCFFHGSTGNANAPQFYVWAYLACLVLLLIKFRTLNDRVTSITLTFQSTMEIWCFIRLYFLKWLYILQAVKLLLLCQAYGC